MEAAKVLCVLTTAYWIWDTVAAIYTTIGTFFILYWFNIIELLCFGTQWPN